MLQVCARSCAQCVPSATTTTATAATTPTTSNSSACIDMDVQLCSTIAREITIKGIQYCSPTRPTYILGQPMLKYCCQTCSNINTNIVSTTHVLTTRSSSTSTTTLSSTTINSFYQQQLDRCCSPSNPSRLQCLNGATCTYSTRYGICECLCPPGFFGATCGLYNAAQSPATTQRTWTTTTSTNVNCQDYNSSVCKYFLSSKNCLDSNLHINGWPMSFSCCASCRQFSTGWEVIY